MKRAAGILLCILLAFPCCISAFSAEVDIVITLSGGTFFYTPEGYYPSAEVNAYKAELKYEVTDNTTGEAVDIPITTVGSYTVRAYMDETYAHSAASSAVTVVISPANAYISVTDVTVAHTAMDNPVVYSIYPAWAEEFLDIDVKYRAISSLSDYGTEVSVPKDMGTYLVSMTAASSTSNVVCSGKYLVYEIAESRGSSLSQSTSLRSVPISFNASVEDVTVTYNGSPIVPTCTLNVAGVDSRVMYRLIASDGSIGTYTETPPSEPGDYVADCFVLDTVVGSGRIVISKMPVDIVMNDCVYTYTPEGVYIPEAEKSPSDVQLNYTAYRYTDGVIGEEVSQPIIECGTYLIKACPENISYYAYTTEYCYLTIKKADPVIRGEDAFYIEDGAEKGVSLTVEPFYAEYQVNYYKLDNKGDAVLIDGAPSRVGDYYAIISVPESKYVNSATAVFGIRIASANSTERAFVSYILKGLCILFAAVGVALGVLHIVWVKRYGRS